MEAKELFKSKMKARKVNMVWLSKQTGISNATLSSSSRERQICHWLNWSRYARNLTLKYSQMKANEKAKYL